HILLFPLFCITYFCHLHVLCSFPTRRSSDLGLVQEIFNQKEFYNVLMHADEERIAQEFLLKKLQSVYLDYINPYSTRVLMLYKRSEEHTSELQSRFDLVCRLLLEKKKKINKT